MRFLERPKRMRIRHVKRRKKPSSSTRMERLTR